MTIHSIKGAVDPATRCEIKNYYSNKLILRDEGDASVWLAAFDGDATLTTNLFDEETVGGKNNIALKVRGQDAAFKAAGIQRRHSQSNFMFSWGKDGTVSVTFYGTMLITSDDGVSRLHSTSVVNDVWKRADAGWQVLSREILRDDLAQSADLKNRPAQIETDATGTLMGE